MTDAIISLSILSQLQSPVRDAALDHFYKRWEDDPLVLASVTIWVPTRRAARSLAGEFLSRFDGDAALLPVIRTLGDADDDGLLLDDDTGSDKGLDAVINPLKRHLILSQLVNQWSTSLSPKQRDL